MFLQHFDTITLDPSFLHLKNVKSAKIENLHFLGGFRPSDELDHNGERSEQRWGLGRSPN